MQMFIIFHLTFLSPVLPEYALEMEVSVLADKIGMCLYRLMIRIPLVAFQKQRLMPSRPRAIIAILPLVSYLNDFILRIGL